jgi:hypothetical protein
MRKLFETNAEYRFTVAHEALIAFDIAWRDPRDLTLHRGIVGHTIKMSAIVENDSIELIESAQIHIVGKLPSAQVPQLFEQEWGRNDRGAGVESEAVLPEDVRPPPRLIEALQHSDAIASRSEADRRSKSAKAAADNDRVRLL